MLLFLLSITPTEHHDRITYIYEHFYQLMFKTAYQISKDSQFSEDILQASFERMIKKIHLINKISCNALPTYVVLLVRGVAINMLRKTQTIPLDDDKLNSFLSEEIHQSTEHTVLMNEEIRAIRSCINALDEKHRTALLFRDYYGYTDRETAELLGIASASTVRSLCSRARKKIAKALEQRGSNHE